MKTLTMLQLILTLAASLFITPLIATPSCLPSQLKVKPIAVATAGMSQTIMFYGIQSTSDKPCQLNASTPTVIALPKHGQAIALSEKTSKNSMKSSVIITPSQNNTQQAKELVWFSIRGDNAHEPGDQDYNTPFKNISAKINGYKNIYHSTYDGYPSGIIISPIKKGVTSPLSNALCSSGDGKLTQDTTLTNTSLIHFDQTMTCN